MNEEVMERQERRRSREFSVPGVVFVVLVYCVCLFCSCFCLFVCLLFCFLSWGEGIAGMRRKNMKIPGGE